MWLIDPLSLALSLRERGLLILSFFLATVPSSILIETNDNGKPVKKVEPQVFYPLSPRETTTGK